MKKIQRVKAIRDNLRKVLEENPEMMGEIELIKEERKVRITKTANKRKEEKYAYKKSLLNIEEDNPLDEFIPEVDTAIDFTDFSENLKSEALSFKNKRKGLLKDKRSYIADKELKRLAKIERTNKHIIAEADRFIAHIVPLVNVWVDENKVKEEYENICDKLLDMKESNRLPLSTFKKSYKAWTEMRSRAEISKPLSAKAIRYKLMYDFKYEQEKQEIEEDGDESI